MLSWNALGAERGRRCPEDLRSEIVQALHLESRRVAVELARLRTDLLTGLSPAGDLWPPAQEPAPPEGCPDPSGPAGAQRVTVLGFSPFFYYPFLFATAFPEVPPEFLRALAAANRILLEALLTLDNRIDRDQRLDPLDLYLMQGYCQRALEILLPYLPPQDAFWEECDELYVAYVRAVLRELVFHRQRVEPFPAQDFRRLSADKAGLVKATILALCRVSGDGRHRDALLASQDAFLIGFQAIDDLKDWREDYARQNYTYLLTAVLENAGRVRAVERGERPDPEVVGRWLYETGLAQSQLRLSEELFRESLDAARDVPVPLWRDMVEGFLRSARSMRTDVAQIRSRDLHRSSRAALPAWSPPAHGEEPGCGPLLASCLSRGARYLLAKRRPDGSFSLALSPHSYMHPARVLGPSGAVTALVLRALAGTGAEEPEIRHLLAALRERPGTAREAYAPSAPAELEQAFRARSREELERIDSGICDGGGRCDADALSAQGKGFWAELVFQAAHRQARAPMLEELALREARQDRDPAGACTLVEAAGSRGLLRPLLVPYLLCKAFAARPDELAQTAVRALVSRVLGGCLKSGSWGNYTDTALALAALLGAGCAATEWEPAARKLVLGQDPDGSWPANAIYGKEGRCYGSRELTTAWCLEALAHCLRQHRERDRESSGRASALGEGQGRIEIYAHEGVAPERFEDAGRLLNRCRRVLRARGSMRVYLGRWAGLPGHFVLADGRATDIGVNLAGPHAPDCTVAGRPTAVELALAWTEAVRAQVRGPVRGGPERLFVEGVGLMVCRRLWPGQTPWEQCGLSRLDWQWCHENEWYLCEIARQAIQAGRAGPAPDGSRPHAAAAGEAFAPANARLYLALRLFDTECRAGLSTESLDQMIEWEPAAIQGQFQKLWGQGRRKISLCL
ncbi:MAG: hypothetical protein AB1640_04205 [bacterium]